MKIISILLIASVTIPLCMSLAAPSVVGLKEFIPGSTHTSLNLVTRNLNSEPVMMIFLGTGLIGIAGIGRKISLKKVKQNKNKKKLTPTIPPYPDPVPWKK